MRTESAAPRPALSDVLRDLLLAPVSSEEKTVIAPLERRRRDLEASDAPIEGTTTVGREARIALSPPRKSLLLYRLVRILEPVSVVEFGTCFGLSAAYIAAGLERNRLGSLLTVEGSPERHAIAVETLVGQARVTSVNGFFDEHLDTLDGADLLFLDGNHQAEPTRRYLGTALARMARPSVIVLDDVSAAWPGVAVAFAEAQASDAFSGTGRAADIGVLTLGWPEFDLPGWASLSTAQRLIARHRARLWRLPAQVISSMRSSATLAQPAVSSSTLI